MKVRERVGNDREKVWFVVSLRDRWGNITYALGDNFSRIPRWGRKVPFTSTLYRDRAMSLMKQRQMRAESRPKRGPNSRRRRNRRRN